ncbi:MAG: protein-L-isoaspartate(D-aspartate) O-methyltransferase [Candidatus Izemoplasmatales bacterium]
MEDRIGNQIETMVDTQLAARGIDDERVLSAFARVPRHVFVEADDVDWAYGDHPLPIGCGQTISQPYVVALSLSAAGVAGAARVLEIGTGSGYQTALMAALAGEVFSVERLKPLFDRARSTLSALGCGNVRLRLGNGTRGWPEEAPYDAIVVSAASRTVPEALLTQLKAGGRLVIPVGGPFAQALTLFTKTLSGTIGTRFLCDCRFVPLIDSD